MEEGPWAMELETKAAVLFATNSSFKITTLNLKAPSEGEVLVRMAYAGLCGSDENVRIGKRPHPFPVVCGHEGAGLVEEIGSGVKRIKKGDSVILNWQPACGGCVDCGEKRPYLCSTYPERVTKEEARFFTEEGEAVYSYSHLGCFAERVVVREECCIPIAKNFPMDVGALIGCAVATGTGAVLNSAKVKEGDPVAIFGMGGVGLSILMAAKFAKASPVIAVDLSESKRRMALDFGATHFLPADGRAPEAIKNLTKGRGVVFAFDAVGNPKATRQCFDSLAPGGSLICLGLPAITAEFSLPTWRVVGGEKRVIGSLYGGADPHQFFPFLADLYSRGKLDFKKLISKVFPLEQINEGVEATRNGSVARVLIRF